MGGWFAAIRRVVVFGLGCWIIADALIDSVHTVPKLVIGMVMVGVLPIENFVFRSPVVDRSKQSIDERRKHELES